MPGLVYTAVLLTSARAQLVDAADSVVNTDVDGHVTLTQSSFKTAGHTTCKGRLLGRLKQGHACSRKHQRRSKF